MMHLISSFLRKGLPAFCYFIIATTAAAAQDTTGRNSAPDTNMFTLFGNEEDHAGVTYVHSIEQAYETLNRVQNGAALSFNIQGIRQQVTADDSALKMMRTATGRRNTNISVRNLQLYRQIIIDIQEEINADRRRLDASYGKLEVLEKQMMALAGDKMMAKLMRDTAAFRENRSKLRRLRFKWRRADSLLQSSFDTLAIIRTEAADNAIAASEMVNRIENRLRKSSIAAMGKEYNFLWEPDSSAVVKPDTAANILIAKKNARRVLNYYVAQRHGKIALFILCFIAFFWWVNRTYRNLRSNTAADSFAGLHLDYLATGRLAASVVAVCCFMPFFDLYAPSSFIELIQLVVILTLSYIFWKRWHDRLFIYWTGLVILFASYFLMSGAEQGFLLRCVLILFNVVSIALAVLFIRELRGDKLLQALVKTAAVVHIILNLLALYSNLVGRMTIAQTFRNAGIYGLTQMVALAVCIQIIQEAVLLQIQSSRARRGIIKSFDITQVTGSLRLPLLIIACVLWLTMFMVNLNIYTPVVRALTLKITTPVRIGSAAFTPGSILLFFAIIWIAHLLQRYTGYIFGDIGLDDEEDGMQKEQRSKMLISKLVILTIGYFLAVAASGLPVDKITIVLGALGVGIGLGLQNIVSNFISGIILIFDRPLQIGDSIEVGNKAGKVKEIGMRSSTLLTPEGAEVIIPNGDILSQQITNWTLSNNYRRLEMSLNLKTDRTMQEVLPVITAIVKSSELVYAEREPVALIDTMKEGEMGVKVLFWCNDTYKAEQVKSELRYLLYTKLREAGINM